MTLDNSSIQALVKLIDDPDDSVCVCVCVYLCGTQWGVLPRLALQRQPAFLGQVLGKRPNVGVKEA